MDGRDTTAHGARGRTEHECGGDDGVGVGRDRKGIGGVENTRSMGRIEGNGLVSRDRGTPGCHQHGRSYFS